MGEEPLGFDCSMLVVVWEQIQPLPQSKSKQIQSQAQRWHFKNSAATVHIGFTRGNPRDCTLMHA